MMTFLLEHLPATLHLIMLTRSDPPLALARLRARGDLREVSTADLRFSQAVGRARVARYPARAGGATVQ